MNLPTTARVVATCLAVIVAAGDAAAGAGGQQQPGVPPSAAQAPARLPQGAGAAPAMPAMQPPVLAPKFLEVGRFYRFILVRKELRGEVLEIDPAGWIRVHFRDDDDDIPRVPWLNLYHITMIVPEGAIEPVDD